MAGKNRDDDEFDSMFDDIEEVAAENDDDGDEIAAEKANEKAAAGPAGVDPAEVIVALNEENNQLKDQLLRMAADAENLKRRTEKEKSDARAYAVEKFAGDLLGVADIFDRALATKPESLVGDALFDGFATGIELTSKELQTVFERHGVKRVGTKGEKFDPALHQAVAQAPADVETGLVADVFQPGYTINGRILRAAMVMVSSGLKPAE